MVSKAQKFRLGIFILISVSLMIIFLVMVIGKKIMEKRDTYYIKYQDTSVNGLQVGGQVKYHGINIGRVDKINIDKDNISNVIVEISVIEDTPLKEDVTATLVPVGITGLKQIELTGGTNQAELLEPGDYINPGQSTFDNITGKAEIIAEKLEKLLNNLTRVTDEENREKITSIITNIDNIITQNEASLNKTITNMDSLANKLITLTNKANTAIDEINSLIQSERIDKIIANSEKISDDVVKMNLPELTENINQAVKDINDTFVHIDRTVITKRQDVFYIVDRLQETVDYLNDFARQLSENPSIILRSRKQE